MTTTLTGREQFLLLQVTEKKAAETILGWDYDDEHGAWYDNAGMYICLSEHWNRDGELVHLILAGLLKRYSLWASITQTDDGEAWRCTLTDGSGNKWQGNHHRLDGSVYEAALKAVQS